MNQKKKVQCFTLDQGASDYITEFARLRGLSRSSAANQIIRLYQSEHWVDDIRRGLDLIIPDKPQKEQSDGQE